MKIISTSHYEIEMGSLSESTLNDFLLNNYSDSKKIILVDENTRNYCLDYLITEFDTLFEAEVIVLPVGEENKVLSIASSVWEALTEYGITRYDLIINLGGGLVTDMGGFIASCYKRGVSFINIPTTLLGMVDASIGGKTGLNLGHYKNQIGVFSNPKVLYIDISFLETLPIEEIVSGFAEMLKHGLIADESLFIEIVSEMTNMGELSEDLLLRCIEIKHEIVKEDPLEKGSRKMLNFGHTIGHVIEGHFIEDEQYTHGYCVAIGMIMESYLSMKFGRLSNEDYLRVSESLQKFYSIPSFTDEDIHVMIKLLTNDKKNQKGKIMCCFLEELGDCSYDNPVSEKEFLDVFFHFKNLKLSLN